jgi:hypothetical protein
MNIYGARRSCPGVAMECTRAAGDAHLRGKLLARSSHPQQARSSPRGGGRTGLHHPHKEAFPLVRYRTGDVTRSSSTPAAAAADTCGWTRLGEERRHAHLPGVNVLPLPVRGASWESTAWSRITSSGGPGGDPGHRRFRLRSGKRSSQRRRVMVLHGRNAGSQGPEGLFGNLRQGQAVSPDLHASREKPPGHRQTKI